MQGIGRACGKIILAGEHAVVYGEPALAGSIDRWTQVKIQARPGPLEISTPNTPGTKLQDDPRLLRAFLCVLPEEGFSVQIQGDLWIGRGLGSSASLSTALIRAWNNLQGGTSSQSDLEQQVMQLETVFHGQPSGIDPAVILRQGLVRFERGARPQAQPLTPPKPLRLVVIDSGTAGDTAALVERVRSGHPENDGTIRAIGQLTHRIERALNTPDALGPLLTENHRLLQDLGVSTPTLDRIVEQVLQAGALGSKLAGAGGGGVVIALVDATCEASVLGSMSAAGYRAFATDLPTRATS